MPQRRAWTLVASTLLVLTNVAWRQKAYYAGGADPTVAAKAGLALIALMISVWLAASAPRRYPVPAPPLLVLLSYLVLSMLGAQDAGNVGPSIILAVRVMLTAATMACLLTAMTLREAARGLAIGMVTVGSLAAVTGVSSLTTGRLSGGFPQVAENELAGLFAIPLFLVMRKVIKGQESTRDRFFILGCLLLIILTGSRTALAATVLTMVILLLHAKRFSLVSVLSICIGLPGLFGFILATGAVQDLFLRGGEQNVGTLSNRTIAWTAAVSYHTEPLSQWLGSGLSVKKIPVAGQYWQTQILDSTWMSALVQAGYAGVIALGVLALMAVLDALVASGDWRPFHVAVLAFLLFRSVMESGLFDSSPAFVAFLLIALTSSRARVLTDPSLTDGLSRPV